MHLLLLVVFSVAVGIVLGGMLRREPRAAATLAAGIALVLVVAAILAAWLLYFLSR